MTIVAALLALLAVSEVQREAAELQTAHYERKWLEEWNARREAEGFLALYRERGADG